MSKAVTVDDRELKALVKRLNKVAKKNPSVIRTALAKIGSIVHGRAVSYAPRSKTKSEYISSLVGNKTKRKPSSFTSGSLKASITTDLKDDRVEIGIPNNSKPHDKRLPGGDVPPRIPFGKIISMIIWAPFIRTEFDDRNSGLKKELCAKST